MIFRFQKHNGFFPARRCTEISAFAAVFARTIGRSDLAYLYAVYFFDGASYLGLIGPFINFEGVRTFCIRKVHPLLCNQRPDYHVTVVKHLPLILTLLVFI
jgi:hypothetical protein